MKNIQFLQQEQHYQFFSQKNNGYFPEDDLSLEKKVTGKKFKYSTLL